MEEFVKGDVIVVNFPFTDQSSSKRRPALVVANPTGDDLILSAITSNLRVEQYSVEINEEDLLQNNLRIKSCARISKLFTIDKTLILYKIDSLKKEKIKEIEENIVKMFLA